MAEGKKDSSNAEVLQALQGMWGQQKDLIQGVERRLSSKIDGAEQKLDAKIDGVQRSLDEKLELTEQSLGDRLAQEIHDRPVVVHVDMSRVSELEKQLQELAVRVQQLEARGPRH